MIAKLSLLITVIFLTVLKFKIPEFDLRFFIFCTLFAIILYFGYEVIFGLIQRAIKSGKGNEDIES